MPNILVMQLSDNVILTHFRNDQDYTNVSAILDEALAKHHELTGTSGKTVSSYAPCDSDLLDTELQAGKSLDTDFTIAQKQEKTASQRIVPDAGVDPATIADTELVVLVTDS